MCERKTVGTVAIVDAAGNQITTFGTANLSVGLTGATVPTSATYLGVNVGGNLTGPSGATAGGITYPYVGIVDSGGNQLPGYTPGTQQAPSNLLISTNFVATSSGGYKYTRITAGQATTIIKASSGTLHAICYNTAATATNTTTVYDNPSTSGTVIAAPAAISVTFPTCQTFDIAFTTGLTIITATANGGDMTVSWF